MGPSPPSTWGIVLCSVAVVSSKATPWGPWVLLWPFISIKVKRTVPGLLINTWYLDDGTVCGSATDLCAALEIIGAEGHLRGLSLNRGKSLLYAPADSSLSNNAFPPDIPVTNGCFKLLGSPVGPASHCESTVLQSSTGVLQSTNISYFHLAFISHLLI